MSENRPDNHAAKSLVTNELVVAYDIMREAANQLRGLYAQEIWAGGRDDPAISKMREIRIEVEAVDPYDLDSIRAMTERLRNDYANHRVHREQGTAG